MQFADWFAPVRGTLEVYAGSVSYRSVRMVELQVRQSAALDYGAEGGMVSIRTYGAGIVTAVVSMAQRGGVHHG